MRCSVRGPRRARLEPMDARARAARSATRVQPHGGIVDVARAIGAVASSTPAARARGIAPFVLDAHVQVERHAGSRPRRRADDEALAAAAPTICDRHGARTRSTASSVGGLPAQAERRGLLDERLHAEARRAAGRRRSAAPRSPAAQAVGQLDEQDVVERMPGVQARVPPAHAGPSPAATEVVDGAGIARLRRCPSRSASDGQRRSGAARQRDRLDDARRTALSVPARHPRGRRRLNAHRAAHARRLRRPRASIASRDSSQLDPIAIDVAAQHCAPVLGDDAVTVNRSCARSGTAACAAARRERGRRSRRRPWDRRTRRRCPRCTPYSSRSTSIRCRVASRWRDRSGTGRTGRKLVWRLTGMPSVKRTRSSRQRLCRRRAEHRRRRPWPRGCAGRAARGRPDRAAGRRRGTGCTSPTTPLSSFGRLTNVPRPR